MDVMDLNAGFPVCVRCMTYNQSAYITDALNGFCMQKTAFPYYVVVFDDASTDGEQKVIKTYLDENFNCSEAHGYKQWEREEAFYVFAQHLENTNCHFLVVYLKKNLYKTARKDDLINEWCKAKYIALCEGDDYWTDPLKLQKQVDFLETHEDYSMCFHKVVVSSDEEWERHFFDHLQEGEYTARQIYEKWTVPTCSVLYRNGQPFESHKSIVYGDIFLWLQLSERGKLYCLGFEGGVYRRNTGGISVLSGYSMYPRLVDQYHYMARRFPELRDLSRKQEEDNLKIVIYMPYFNGICRYRFRYMWFHPRLFFSAFFTTTILSYTPFRHH